jgi:hypothetical protein
VTAEPLIHELTSPEFEISTEKFERHKSPSTDQIPAAWIQAGRNM